MENEIELLKNKINRLESAIRDLTEKYSKDADECDMDPEDAGDEEQYIIAKTSAIIYGDCADSLNRLLKAK